MALSSCVHLVAQETMSKRKREEAGDNEPDKKQRKGFSVGPANLPDGTYRRKTQKIKNDLIQKAKVKKAYAKLKAQEPEETDQGPTYDPYADAEDPTRPAARDEVREDAVEDDQDTANEIHPERQAMLDRPDREAPVQQQNSRSNRKPRRDRDGRNGRHDDGEPNANHTELGARQPRAVGDVERPTRYKKEFAQAEERKEQVVAREKAREQREKERRAMAKARKPGKDGKQKLGRQSDALLSRVQRLVGST